MIDLFPFQVAGAEFLGQRRLALLADEMGLGKTAQAITAVKDQKIKKVLVVCPASLRLNWIDEWVKFGEEPHITAHLSSQDTLMTDRVVTSFDLLWKNLPLYLAQNWDLLIIDEGHFLKSLETNRTRAVFGKEGVCRKTKRIWVLTGTPMPNHAGELWPMLYTFGITKLKYDDFVKKYCNTITHSYGVQILGTKKETTPELREMLAKIMLRRKVDDVLKDLPPITFSEIAILPPPNGVRVDELEMMFPTYFIPTPMLKKFNEDMGKQEDILRFVLEQGGTVAAEALPVLANSLSTLRRYTALAKLDGVADIVHEELKYGAYDKVVIFAIHQTVIEGLKLRLAKYHPVTLYGGTPIERRHLNVKKFQTDPKCRVFIGNIQAAGTGITLTAANQIIFLEQDWVPGNNAQAAMRCRRIGQTKPVFVRVCGLHESVDQKVAQILKKKMHEIACVFETKELTSETYSANRTLEKHAEFVKRHKGKTE